MADTESAPPDDLATLSRLDNDVCASLYFFWACNLRLCWLRKGGLCRAVPATRCGAVCVALPSSAFDRVCLSAVHVHAGVYAPRGRARPAMEDGSGHSYQILHHPLNPGSFWLCVQILLEQLRARYNDDEIYVRRPRPA